MLIDSEQRNISKPKHSKLSIITLGIFVSPVIPFILIFAFTYRIIPMFLNYDQCLLLSSFSIQWCILAPILSLILSIIDLKSPGRAKILPKIILITCSIIICLGIIISVIAPIYEVNRLFN